MSRAQPSSPSAAITVPTKGAGANLGFRNRRTSSLHCTRSNRRVSQGISTLARASESEDEPDPLGCMRELLVKALTRLAQDAQSRRIHDILRYKCEYTGELVGLRERLQALSAECDQRIARALGNAVSRGQLPAQLDCRRAAVCLHAYMEGVEANWLLVPDFDLAAQAPALVDAVLDMLRSSPALRSPA